MLSKLWGHQLSVTAWPASLMRVGKRKFHPSANKLHKENEILLWATSEYFF